jgi:hypothetical protein
MPAVKNAQRAGARRGVTLLELLVVISILILVMLVFATVLGPGATGPALERNARSIRAMVANVRQNSSVRNVHSELVFDYKHDRIVALARRRLVSFSFDGASGALGSGNVIGLTSGSVNFQASRDFQLLDGAALELQDNFANFTIPWMPHYDIAGDYEGIAVSFDYYPLAAAGPDGYPPVVPTGALVSMGSVFTLSVAGARNDCVRLALTAGGLTVASDTWVALDRWCRIEVAVSRYGVSLFVDGRVSDAIIPDTGITIASAANTEVRIGGVPCRVDNFEMSSLISSQTLELNDVRLVPWGVWAEKMVSGEADGIYDWKADDSPVTGDPAAPPPSVQGLPNQPVPAIVHLHFDPSGKLDPARHPGAVFLYLVAIDGDEVVRMELVVHPLGAVTWEYIDLFPWEPRPAAPAAGGGS